MGQCGPHAAAYGFFDTKSIVEDRDDDIGQIGNVYRDDDKRQQDVRNRHDRHDHVGDFCNPAYATIDNKARDNGQQNSRPDPVDTEAVMGGSGDGVALKSVEADGEGGNQTDGVEDCGSAIIRPQTVHDR